MRHYTATVYIHFISFLLCISILEKLYSLLFHVESNRFLVLFKFLSYCYSCCFSRKEHATNVATSVAGGTLRF